MFKGGLEVGQNRASWSLGKNKDNGRTVRVSSFLPNTIYVSFLEAGATILSLFPEPPVMPWFTLRECFVHLSNTY